MSTNPINIYNYTLGRVGCNLWIYSIEGLEKMDATRAYCEIELDDNKLAECLTIGDLIDLVVGSM